VIFLLDLFLRTSQKLLSRNVIFKQEYVQIDFRKYSASNAAGKAEKAIPKLSGSTSKIQLVRRRKQERQKYEKCNRRDKKGVNGKKVQGKMVNIFRPHS